MIKQVLIGLFLYAAVSGCSIFGIDGEEADLKSNRQKWQKQNISHYQFELSISCFCPAGLTPAIVVVRADTIHSVLNPETGETLLLPESDVPALEKNPDHYSTIDGLFERIEHAIDQDAHRLDVNYHSKFGYPAQIDVEYFKNATDDEVRYLADNFKEL